MSDEFFTLFFLENDPCFPNPCKNHGVCTHDGTTATCICALKFRGPKCSGKISSLNRITNRIANSNF